MSSRRADLLLKVGLISVAVAVVTAYAMATPVPDSPARVATTRDAAATPHETVPAATPKDDRWFADESARGTRPDAAH
jgi:hypothetical protein